jgi:hypothetical protein
MDSLPHRRRDFSIAALVTALVAGTSAVLVAAIGLGSLLP